MAYFNIFQKKWLETATLEPLEVPVEPRTAAEEHVAAPVPRYHILIMPVASLADWVWESFWGKK